MWRARARGRITSGTCSHGQEATALLTSTAIDRWDSGAVGLIWADEDDVSSWFGGVPTSREKASKRLDFEVERYSQWVGGETYAVMLSDAEGNVLDFVCGYIGDDGLEIGIEDMREQAKRAA